MKSGLYHLWLLVAFVFILSSCIQGKAIEDPRGARAAALKAAMVDELQGSEVAVFFSPFDELDQKVLALLDEAQEELIIGHYNIRSPKILDKLVALSRRGVRIRVAVDQKNANYEWNTGDDYLQSMGIEVVRTKPNHKWALMHLKVAVIDQMTVMTGSYNWNSTATVTNDENMILIRNPQVAAIYRNEVLEVLGAKTRVVEGGRVTGKISVHFAPEENLAPIISNHLDQAEESIDIAMFTFTQFDIASRLYAAAERGVKVRVIMENKQADYATIDENLEKIAEVVLIRGANKLSAHSAMHHKYCIIDGRKVLTGAANWTVSGTQRSEEDLIILEDGETAGKYRRNFRDLMYIYGGRDVTPADEERRGAAPILFHVIHGNTRPGDRIILVGNVPELGNWNPAGGIELETEGGFYPNWFVNTWIRTGSPVAYKFVTIRKNGSMEWEQGDNRALNIPLSGRAVVISGDYGDTSKNWTPAPAGAVAFKRTFERVYFRGDANHWQATAMTLADHHLWKLTVSGRRGERFKFDIKGDWTYNFGDYNNDGIADQNGSDISFSEDGAFEIVFNDQTREYRIQ